MDIQNVRSDSNCVCLPVYDCHTNDDECCCRATKEKKEGENKNE